MIYIGFFIVSFIAYLLSKKFGITLSDTDYVIIAILVVGDEIASKLKRRS